MNKLLFFLVAFCVAVNAATANVVTSSSAQAVAVNFYKQNTNSQMANPVLAYTEKSADGTPVYYVFDMNGKEGFVIVSAEDAGHPVLGYSTEGNFVIPDAHANSNFSYWMELRKKEIADMRIRNVQATAEIKNEWTNYINNKVIAPKTMSSVAPLVQSTWNQSGGGSPSYNSLCPNHSVTGCCATAMAQIMRFWSYPAKGTGSDSYCDCSNTNSNYTQNYGTLSVNFSTETYNWAAMPYASSSAGAAQISYDCGVALETDYSPGGSGAEVIAADYPVCTQTALVKYFGYDPTTIQGLLRSNYTDTAWVLLLDNELNIGRPINYCGFDASSGEGHSWICDGYNTSNYFHMNWGWAGSDDGYFYINNLQTTNGNFTPDAENEALIGIQPPPNPSLTLDAGVFSITSPSGTTCAPDVFTPEVTIRNYGSDTLKSCTIDYNLDGTGNQTYNWNGSLGFYQSALISLPTMTITASGQHVFTSITNMPNSSIDGNMSNDTLRTTINVLSNTASQQAPYSEGFETSGFPYTDCYVTSQSGPQWIRTTSASFSGSASMELNNYSATGGDFDEFITPSIDLSTIAIAALSFDLAFAQLDSNDVNNHLDISASTDCGNTWTQLYTKTGAALATTGAFVPSSFTPASQSQWRNEIVNLSSLTGQTDVRFQFQFSSYPFFDGSEVFYNGNNIFIDDINILVNTTGVAEDQGQGVDFSVYPNPVADNANIFFTLAEKKNVTVNVYDIVGRKVLPVFSGALTAGTHTLAFNRSDLKSGIYFVKMIADGCSLTKKVVIE